ncbi:HupE/UreJ family protein [Sessilibacter corallicola]|uniref:HupE/UreJ family protein n=1 Tax=Sessilibacter corallicola TaxID=2904075 RepID=UPI001E2A8761|nr:HupE/UreJ family protein [Sessilibacter corallicola]MCE2029684.1 HupE/UreJ family protein [Sessilibacter corallicola]
MRKSLKFKSVLTILLSVLSVCVFAHGVDDNTRSFLESNTGVQLIPFMYIGAKHMVTGYDHLLFLVGVVFFLYKSKDILLYVTMFTMGHSITLMWGVLGNINVNAYLIDAIIGLSVVYKGFDNLGGFKRLLGYQPNVKWAILVFGLFHGFGLATKLQEFKLPEAGLLENLIAFNIGVELGQFIALAIILIAINFWRHSNTYERFATVTNTALMSAGFILIGFQITDLLISNNG